MRLSHGAGWPVQSRVEQLEPLAAAPLSARIALNRLRYGLAGEAAALADDPEDLAWVLHSVTHSPTSRDDSARHAFLLNLEAASAAVTTVFLAQGRHRCRAAVIHDGVWSLLELNGLCIDTIGPAISAAHYTHDASRDGVILAGEKWRSARQALEVALRTGVRPLVEHLGSRPLALRLSGWLHATPIAPVLTAALNYETPVVVSLGLDTPDRAGLSRDQRVAVVAAGGDGYRYNHLAHVAEDLDALRELFDEVELVRFHDATVENALLALESAQIVLVAGHGASAAEPHQSSLIFLDGVLTAEQILTRDLAGLTLAVLAACEASAVDRRAPEHPLSAQTAMIFAGARASCGPMWRVDDAIASTFSTALMRSIAAGQGVLNAFLDATRVVDAEFPATRQFVLHVDSEDGLQR